MPVVLSFATSRYPYEQSGATFNSPITGCRQDRVLFFFLRVKYGLASCVVCVGRNTIFQRLGLPKGGIFGTGMPKGWAVKCLFILRYLPSFKETGSIVDLLISRNEGALPPVKLSFCSYLNQRTSLHVSRFPFRKAG